MSIWLEQVYTYLFSLGVVDNSEWLLNLGYLTDDQDQVVALFSFGGPPAQTLQTENRYIKMQLRVRAARLSFPIAYAKWKECFDALNNAREGTGTGLEGFRYITAGQLEPLSFTDKKGRANLTSTWDILIDN